MINSRTSAYGTTKAARVEEPESLPLPTNDADVLPTSQSHAANIDTEVEVVRSILRLLTEANEPRPLTPMEYALISGARRMFKQLSALCGELLKKATPVLNQELTPAGETPSATSPTDSAPAEKKRREPKAAKE